MIKSRKGIKIPYQGKEIVATIWEQQIWFSVSDIVKIAGVNFDVTYSDEKAIIDVDGTALETINEFGLYRVLSSLGASDFRKWLISDAIVRLRKYGCYKLSITEEKEKLISEIEELLVELNQGVYIVEKMKFYSLDKLKTEKKVLEMRKDRKDREKEKEEKRRRAKKDYQYTCFDLEGKYDINLAISNLEWNNENLDDYMMCIGDGEYLFNDKFVEYLENGEYRW